MLSLSKTKSGHIGGAPGQYRGDELVGRLSPTPAITTAAITGALPRKSQTQTVPITPAEQVESTHEAFEAGAALVCATRTRTCPIRKLDPDIGDAAQPEWALPHGL